MKIQNFSLVKKIIYRNFVVSACYFDSGTSFSCKIHENRCSGFFVKRDLTHLCIGDFFRAIEFLFFFSYENFCFCRKETTFAANPEASLRSFKSFPHPRPSQSAAEAMDRNGVLFYGLTSEVAIACWNSQDFPEFGGRNSETVVTNKETLQFPSGMKVTKRFTILHSSEFLST